MVRWPTRIARVDACPQEMGGYGLQSGDGAWQLQLDPDLIGRGSLTLLELLAALIGIWVKHEMGMALGQDDIWVTARQQPGGWQSRALVMSARFTSSSPGLLWRDTSTITQSHTTLSGSLEKRTLSPTSFPATSTLTMKRSLDSLLRENFSNQLPHSFRLVRLTTAMISDVGNLLRLLLKMQQLPREPVPNAAAVGANSIPGSSRNIGPLRRPVPQTTRGQGTNQGVSLLCHGPTRRVTKRRRWNSGSLPWTPGEYSSCRPQWRGTCL